MSRDIDFTQPLDEADEAYVAQRPWLLRDAELKGIEVSYERDAFTQETEDETEDEHEESDETVDYSKLNKDELKAEIERRNDEREDEDEHVQVAAPGNKPELIAALVADDELNEPDDEEEDDE